MSVDEGTNNAEKEDIREEREKVMQANDIEMAVVVRDLYKFYGNFAAVKNVSFGVGRKECFGLLGRSTFVLLFVLTIHAMQELMVLGRPQRLI